jgi:hypothetical protein
MLASISVECSATAVANCRKTLRPARPASRLEIEAAGAVTAICRAVAANFSALANLPMAAGFKQLETADTMWAAM